MKTRRSTLTSRFTPTLAAACLAALLSSASALAGEEAPKQPKKEDIELMELQPRQERINMEMVRNRRNRGTYSSSDRVDRIQFTIKLTNQETSKEFKDLKGIFIITVQNVAEKKRFMALLRQEFPVTLGKGTADREMKWESEDKATAYYEYYSSKSGEEYDGWIFALVDADGKIVAHKASKESYDENIAKIGWIKEGNWFDLRLDPTEAAFEGNRHYTEQ